jgi:hypothetical protein
LAPGSPGVPPIPDDLSLTAAETLDKAQSLLDAGLAFQAHEVLESRWKAAPPSERELWRALAQLAVGITHVQRGNRSGAVRLLLRAAGGLEHAGDPSHRVPAAALATWARALSARIEQIGPDDVDAGDLTPRLR